MTESEKPVCWVRNVDVETDTPVEGIVSGVIPEWLKGTLIRNGSGVYQIGQTSMNHLFDGMSVMHRFAIRDGKVTYQNRIQRNETYLSSKESNRLTMTQFGTFAAPDPCKSILGRFMSRFDMKKHPITDNCSVNVCYFGDALYAMTETVNIHRIDTETLDVVGSGVSVSKYVAVNHATAHPHIEEDGTVYNMGNSYGSPGPAYNIIEFPPGSEDAPFTGAKIVATIPARWKFHPSYYHSFAITENYFVFAELPLAVDAFKAMGMNLLQEAFNSTLKWYPKEKARFYLVERKTGNLVKTIYEAPGFFCFHHGNAFERENELIVDLCHIKDGSIMEDLSLARLRENKGDFTNAFYTRYILPLKREAPEKSQFGQNLIQSSGSACKSYWTSNTTIMCEPERLCDHSMELPRINYKYNGRPYRFAYAASMNDGFSEAVRMIKLDVESREFQVWERDGLSVSEPVFVARPESASEDDGIILFSAVDPRDEKRVLLVMLDAATFQEVASVEFKAAGTVSKDFHGIFSLDGEQIHRY